MGNMFLAACLKINKFDNQTIDDLYVQNFVRFIKGEPYFIYIIQDIKDDYFEPIILLDYKEILKEEIINYIPIEKKEIVNVLEDNIVLAAVYG